MRTCFVELGKHKQYKRSSVDLIDLDSGLVRDSVRFHHLGLQSG